MLFYWPRRLWNKIPPTIRNVIRHALKPVFCVAVLSLFYPLYYTQIYNIFDNLKTNQPIIPDLLVSLGREIIFLIFLFISTYLLLQYTDKNDETAIAKAIEMPNKPYLKQWEYTVEFSLTLLLVGIAFLPPIHRLLSIPWKGAYPIVSYAIAVAAVLLLRTLQLSLLRSWHDAQARLGKKRVVGKVSRHLFNGFVLLLMLYFVPAVIFFGLYLLISLFSDFALNLLYGVFIIVFLILFFLLGRTVLRLWRRHRFLQRIRRLEKGGTIRLTVEGHPYLSLFSPSFLFNLTVECKNKKRYRACLITCKKRRNPLILEEESCTIVHGFHFGQRIVVAPGLGGFGGARILDNRATLFEFRSIYDLTFPKGEGEPVLILDNPPARVLVEFGETARQLDNGDTVFGYHVYTKNAFFNFIERCTLD